MRLVNFCFSNCACAIQSSFQSFRRSSPCAPFSGASSEDPFPSLSRLIYRAAFCTRERSGSTTLFCTFTSILLTEDSDFCPILSWRLFPVLLPFFKRRKRTGIHRDLGFFCSSSGIVFTPPPCFSVSIGNMSPQLIFPSFITFKWVLRLRPLRVV